MNQVHVIHIVVFFRYMLLVGECVCVFFLFLFFHSLVYLFFSNPNQI